MEKEKLFSDRNSNPNHYFLWDIQREVQTRKIIIVEVQKMSSRNSKNFVHKKNMKEEASNTQISKWRVKNKQNQSSLTPPLNLSPIWFPTTRVRSFDSLLCARNSKKKKKFSFTWNLKIKHFENMYLESLQAIQPEF